MTGNRSVRYSKGVTVVTAGHSTKVEGLDDFIRQVLNQWPEVDQVRLGAIQQHNRVGRKSKRLKPSSPVSGALTAVHAHKRARGGGGFQFWATRPAMVGSVITGIKCSATYGMTTQEVVLCGPDLDAIWSQLQANNYASNR